MANELLERPVTYEVNGEEVKLTGNMVAQFLRKGNKQLSEQEVVLFINLCRYQHLNPFLNEAYIVKFKDEAQIIVSKEAFMKRAENHPQFAGFKAGIVVERNGGLVELPGALKLSKDKLVGGWAKVFRRDREEPTEVQIALSEFTKGQSTWNTMPNTMIRKTAIVNALREAFPEALGAMYTEDDKNPTIKPAEQVVEKTEKEEQLENLIAEPETKEEVQEEAVEESEEQVTKIADVPGHPEIEVGHEVNREKKNDMPDFSREDDVYAEFEDDLPF